MLSNLFTEQRQSIHYNVDLAMLMTNFKPEKTTDCRRDGKKNEKHKETYKE